MPELNPSPQITIGKVNGTRETPVVINTEPTPKEPSPEFPIGVKPELSPNPALTYVKKDGGRGTPVIETTEPKKQEETGGSSFDPSYLEAEIALKEDSANKSSSIGATPSEVKFPTEKAVADYVQAKALAGLPTITIAVSQVVSQSPLQIQLTNEQYATMNGHSVIVDLSALSIPNVNVVTAIFNGSYENNGVTYLNFVVIYNEDTSSLHFNRIFVNVSTKVAEIRFEHVDPAYSGTSGLSEETNSVNYLTTAPSSNNPGLNLVVIVLSSEPATRYDGYLYIITGSN